MTSTRCNCAVEMQEQVIVEVTEVMEIEVSMMIEDVINVGLWETLPKLSMEHVTEIVLWIWVNPQYLASPRWHDWLVSTGGYCLLAGHSERR